MSDPTKERILEAAGEIFAEKGFDRATVREICGRAGSNLASVNYHFGDKQQLYVEAVKRAHCESEETGELEIPASLTPDLQLYAFVHQLMQDMLDRDTPVWQLELVMREMSRPTAACEELVRGFIGPKFEQLLLIVKKLGGRRIRKTDQHLFAFSIVGQCLLYRYHRPIGRLLIGEEAFESLFDVDRLSAHITNFCLNGFGQAPVEPSELARLSDKLAQSAAEAKS